MSYVEQWNAIAARIRSLHGVADLYAQFLIAGEEDGHGISRHLRDQSLSILETLRNFYQSFHPRLPPNAKACLERFVRGQPADILSENFWFKMDGPVLLTALEAEMAFFLADVQEAIRARSERAFLHLQRLLVVDAELRDRWKAAFNKTRAGEVSCEQLGAVHLLWHGIFAFKVDAHGARTDLVFSEPVDVSATAQRGIEGLVLTEWKLVDAGDALSRFEEARDQAALYRQSALVDTELTSYRYAVAVSLTDLPKGAVPEDKDIGGVVYRHINIAIEPRPPSVQARAK